ncbi:guanine nucleotide exchange factor [Gorgonomyces haynaldii]|nr:guanine nucleotide exchange factor [Gorgonomyces haynaldii]
MRLERNEPKLSQELDAFITQNATKMKLVEEQALSLESKTTLVQDLVQALDYDNGWHQEWSSETTGKAIKVLRLLSREKLGFEASLNPQTLASLCQFAGLGDAVPDSYTNELVLEALKCISNLQIHDLQLRDVFSKSAFAKNIPLGFKSSGNNTVALYMLTRLLFLASATNQQLIPYYISQNIPDLFSQILNAIVDEKIQQQENVTPLLLQHEILKASFNLSLQLPSHDGQGGLFGQMTSKDNSENIPFFKNLLESILKTIKTLPKEKPLLSQVMESYINALMNFPVKPFENIWFPEKDLAILDQIANTFDDTIQFLFPMSKEGQPSEDVQLHGIGCDQALAPILILLKNLANEHQNARNHLRKRYMPLDLDRNNPLDKGKRMINYLVRFMTSLTCDNIRDCTSEFVFAMLEPFVGYLGYGTCAGFLMNRGLFTGLPQEGSKEASQFGDNIDPITGTIKKETPNPWEGMTDEEKEREAERLFVLFDRLNKTGVFEPINPFNPNNK